MLAKIIAYLRNQGSFCGEHYHKFRFEKPIVLKNKFLKLKSSFTFGRKSVHSLILFKAWL